MSKLTRYSWLHTNRQSAPRWLIWQAIELPEEQFHDSQRLPERPEEERITADHPLFSQSEILQVDLSKLNSFPVSPIFRTVFPLPFSHVAQHILWFYLLFFLKLSRSRRLQSPRKSAQK